MIDFILVLVAMLVAFVAMLAINHIVYKREKTLLEVNEKYKRYYYRYLDDWDELKRLLLRTSKEKNAYRKAIDDCIVMFNATYSNTKLSFDEANCAFVIEDIDANDSLPTEEEITQQNENNDENN